MAGRRRQQPLTRERRELFLAALAECGNIGQAAREASPRAVGDASATFRDARRRDPEGFGAAVEDALEAFRDKIRQEAYRRGIQGVPVDVRDAAGTVIGQRVVASDRVLLELMRGRLKEHQPVKRVEAVVEQTVTQRPGPEARGMEFFIDRMLPENQELLLQLLQSEMARPDGPYGMGDEYRVGNSPSRNGHASANGATDRLPIQERER